MFFLQLHNYFNKNTKTNEKQNLLLITNMNFCRNNEVGLEPDYISLQTLLRLEFFIHGFFQMIKLLFYIIAKKEVLSRI